MNNIFWQYFLIQYKFKIKIYISQISMQGQLQNFRQHIKSKFDSLQYEDLIQVFITSLSDKQAKKSQAFYARKRQLCLQQFNKHLQEVYGVTGNTQQLTEQPRSKYVTIDIDTLVQVFSHLVNNNLVQYKKQMQILQKMFAHSIRQDFRFSHLIYRSKLMGFVRDAAHAQMDLNAVIKYMKFARVAALFISGASCKNILDNDNGMDIIFKQYVQMLSQTKLIYESIYRLDIMKPKSEQQQLQQIEEQMQPQHNCLAQNQNQLDSQELEQQKQIKIIHILYLGFCEQITRACLDFLGAYFQSFTETQNYREKIWLNVYKIIDSTISIVVPIIYAQFSHVNYKLTQQIRAIKQLCQQLIFYIYKILVLISNENNQRRNIFKAFNLKKYPIVVLMFILKDFILRVYQNIQNFKTKLKKQNYEKCIRDGTGVSMKKKKISDHINLNQPSQANPQHKYSSLKLPSIPTYLLTKQQYFYVISKIFINISPKSTQGPVVGSISDKIEIFLRQLCKSVCQCILHIFSGESLNNWIINGEKIYLIDEANIDYIDLVQIYRRLSIYTGFVSHAYQNQILSHFNPNTPSQISPCSTLIIKCLSLTSNSIYYKSCPVVPIKIWSKILATAGEQEIQYRNFCINQYRKTLIANKKQIINLVFQGVSLGRTNGCQAKHWHSAIFIDGFDKIIKELSIAGVVKSEQTKQEQKNDSNDKQSKTKNNLTNRVLKNTNYIGHIISLMASWFICLKLYINKYSALQIGQNPHIEGLKQKRQQLKQIVVKLEQKLNCALDLQRIRKTDTNQQKQENLRQQRVIKSQVDSDEKVKALIIDLELVIYRCKQLKNFY